MSGTLSNALSDDDFTDQSEVELVKNAKDSFLKPTEIVNEVSTDEMILTEGTPFPVIWKNPIKFLFRVISNFFAFASLMLVLGVVAAIPLVNFYVLGAFLNAEGGIGRSGKIRNGFPLFQIAPRIVMLAAGFWFFLLPLRFLAGFAADAHLIDPGSSADFGFTVGLNVAWGIVTVHLILALARGGTFWCFVRPFKNLFWVIGQLRTGNYFAEADQQIQAFFKQLEVRKQFWIGFRGFAVALIWLFFPTVLYTIAKEPEGGQILLTVIGGFALAIVLSWVPFLQAQFAVEDRFAAGFRLKEIRSLYSYAPIVWSLSTVVLYLLSLPLYLFKAFLLPQDAMWPITFIFVLSIYPTRLLTGWAYQRAVKKRTEGRRAHWVVRWLVGGTLISLLGVYVFILYFTQFLGEQGKAELFHHHSLLLPAPF